LGIIPKSETMALTEVERQRCEKAIAGFLERRRPPAHIRDQLDIDCRIAGQSVEVFEVRPQWQDRSRRMETPVAKATFVRTTNRWKVFWMRRDLKWHGYEPDLEVRSVEAFLHVVDRDEYCCFFG
jgi:hypothetical protein